LDDGDKIKCSLVGDFFPYFLAMNEELILWDGLEDKIL